MRLLNLIGVGAVLYKLFSSVSDSVYNNIIIEFKSVKLSDFNLIEGKVKLTLSITNKNPVAFTVKAMSGLAYFGQLSNPILLEQEFTTPPDTTVNASFDFPVDNGLLLEQLGNQIESGSLPQLRLVVSMTAGVKDKFLTVPIDTIIPIL